jgi:hypothetical protein
MIRESTSTDDGKLQLHLLLSGLTIIKYDSYQHPKLSSGSHLSLVMLLLRQRGGETL